VFTIYTNHKPLVDALVRSSDPWTARQCRHLVYVAEFTSHIQHVPGEDNVVADALSRLPHPSVAAVQPAPSAPSAAESPVIVDLRGIATRQATCSSTQEAIGLPSLQVERQAVDGVVLWCSLSSGRARLLIPATDRELVFQAIRGLSHPRIRATRRLLAARILWPGMNKDIAGWCRDCVQCQRAKVTKQPDAPLQPIAIPRRRFSHVHVDLVGPLPVAAMGETYLFTIIHRTSRCLEVATLKDMSAQSCTDAFVSTWVACYGVPETLTTDRGAQFTSDTWSLLCSRLGTTHVTTTAYHPQSNGLVECAHRQLKASLHARQAGADWPAHLPWVLLGLRAAPKEVSGVSLTEAVFGQPLVLPGEVAHGPKVGPLQFKEELASARPPLTRQPGTYAEVAGGSPSAALQAAKFVYVRQGGAGTPLAAPYLGPFKVVTSGPKFFSLEVGEKVEMVSVDRLKPHHGQHLPVVAEAAKRGHPRKVPSAAVSLVASS
jgi:transposase InsO family protein